MLNRWSRKRRKTPSLTPAPKPVEEKQSVPLPSSAEALKQRLESAFGGSFDFVVETVQVGGIGGIFGYLSTMTDSKTIAEKVLEPLALAATNGIMLVSEQDWERLAKSIFAGAKSNTLRNEQEVISAILSGYAVLFLDGLSWAVALMIDETVNRAITEPTTQTIIRGPKEGFIENAETNVSLIRRRLKNASLRFENYTIGSETETSVYIAYLDGVANEQIVGEVRKRVKDIRANAVFDSATIEEYVQDKTFTPFPLIYNSERPDTVTGHLMSGKVAVFVDGSPFVLTMPSVFTDFLIASEDYYQNFMMTSFIRLIRYASFLLALLLPSFYVGIITFHHEMLPTPLIISIIAQREGIPFPAVVEAFIMEITFEILREAGVRMPRAVGGTIAIVGGLVIGQAAVEAGLVSNIMVIVVALTAIASYVSPVYSFSISGRLLRFVFIILAAFLGLFGILLGLIAMVGHLASLRSFSVPYLAPVGPIHWKDQNDVILRFPSWANKERPAFLRTKDPVKQPNAKAPVPPKKGGSSS